ncbi:MAG TPA: insulinase family protein [Gemmatimonadaceae bacterium]|nr:insulinase family protein [Gemmatimonadaceae bacterium]
MHSLPRLVGALGLSAVVAGPLARAQQASHDPALAVGTLPNGFRYYLRPNAMPSHRVELRFVVDAGSLFEDEDQRGYAHFLEHMAFNGTRHFPHHTLVDFLETSGMRFGADLNAETTQDETVYSLTLPTDDSTLLRRGLDVIQDWASGGIMLDSADVVAERGVVMGEWRSRLPDTASQALQNHTDSVFVGTTRYLTRQTIGDTTLVLHATPAPIRRFYRDWYRPGRLTIVAVGDFNRATMEQEVRRRFGSIPAGPTRQPVTPVLPSSTAWVTDVYEGTVVPGVEVLWPAPKPPADARMAEQQKLLNDLLTESVSERLLRIRSHPSRSFITADLEQGRVVRSLSLIGVRLIAWPDSLERGLTTVLTELERLAQHGVPEARLAHQKAVLLSHLEHAALAESGRASRAYADEYAEHALTGDGTLLSAQQELAFAKEILPTITPDAVAAVARFWRQSAGARVLVNLPAFAHVRPPTRESMLAIIDSVSHATLAPDSDATAAAAGALVATPPTPGHIVDERQDTVAGITEWTLSNGARVVLKPSRNDPDQLLMRAWAPGGFAATPDSLFFTPGRMVARVMTDIGGLASTGHDALNDRLATTGLTGMTVDIGYADQSIQLDGSPTDVEMLFQLLHLQFASPMLDTATLAGWQSLVKYQGPAFSLDDNLNELIAKGNPRLRPVSTNIAELATVKQLMAVYRNRFGNAGGFTFILVGAISPDEARPLVERYLASLPGFGKIEPPVAAEDHTFLHRVNQIVWRLEQPKAQTLLVFDGAFSSAPNDYLRERQRLSALTGIVEDRIRTRLRRQLGGTYSPYVSSETYTLPEERYRAVVAFDAAPERMHEMNHAMMQVLDSVRMHGVTAAEASRAATVQHRLLETRLQDNRYWLNVIGIYSRLGIPLDSITHPYPEREVSPAEIQAAANTYMPGDVYIHLTAMPEDSTLYMKGGSAP